MKLNSRAFALVSIAFIAVNMAAVNADAAPVAASASVSTSCKNGGDCRVGDVGPGGGVVFYDAGSVKWWGRYLEARHLDTVGVPWSLRSQEAVFEGDASTVLRRRVDAKAIGMGAVNTMRIVAQSGSGKYAASIVDRAVLGGRGDWFLPSKDELNALYNYRAIRGMASVPDGPYWSSTEAGRNIAWYQLFQDGTQFSDSYLLAATTGNKVRNRNIKYPGTTFPSLKYGVIAVRAFPAGSGVEPDTSLPALTGNTCTDTGPCAVGDIGPAGGVVFYAAANRQSWGRYLEVSPRTAEVIGWPWRKPGYDAVGNPVYRDAKQRSARVARVLSKAVGMGEANTNTVARHYGKGRYAAWYAYTLNVNGYDDWFLPSADELDLMYNRLYAVAEPLIGFAPTYYWSSSEYNLHNAWTVLFRSGQRFDREGWFTTKDTGEPNAMRARPIRAFG